MKTYKFIEYSGNETLDSLLLLEIELEKLLGDCDFIVTTYSTMHHKDDIKRVGDSHRGSTIEFKDGTMTYYYNISGGYSLENK